MAITRKADFSNLTSMGVGGYPRDLYEPESFGELCELLAVLDDPFILGGGCNTIFPDGDFSRPVIRTKKLGKLHVEEDGRVYAEAGVAINRIIRQTVTAGLCGLEQLAGIPGTVGGGTAMNAGNGPDACFSNYITKLHVIAPEADSVETIDSKEVPWRYRNWGMNDTEAGGASSWVVVAVEMKLQPGDVSELRAEMDRCERRKSDNQPLNEASSGCMFKNPGAGPSAGKLIEGCGLKGLREGGASVSGVHANFIVNGERQASAEDVKRLMERVIEQVYEQTGCQLEPEVVFASDLAFV